MKKNYFFTLTIILLIGSNIASGQTIWTGPTITFTKDTLADFTMETNQDRITDNVWITRGNTQGIFNIATEQFYNGYVSPADTEWAFGTTADLDNLTFQDWETTHDSAPPSTVNMDMVLHLITDDIFIDIKFTLWASAGAGGGAFSYERSTDPSTNTFEQDLSKSVKVFPNPSSDFIKVSGINEPVEFEVTDLVGHLLLSGIAGNNEPVSIQDLATGLYILKLNSSHSILFTKK